jgi:hypothetical protein
MTPDIAGTGSATAKPVKVTFIQWTGDNLEDVRNFARDEFFNLTVDGVILVMFKDTKLIQPLYRYWYIARHDGNDWVRVMSKRNFDWLFRAD